MTAMSDVTSRPIAMLNVTHYIYSKKMFSITIYTAMLDVTVHVDRNA
jgi:hypothetical protein